MDKRADAGRAAAPRRVQILRRGGRAGDRAGPDRHRRAQRLRQIQPGRGAALGHGRELGQTPARRRDGRRDLRRLGTAAGPQHRRSRADDRQQRPRRAVRLQRPRAIEVVRRIVRGGGSTYRINGREARARDVQLLFADAASGAHSGAMVSQGRIGALIEAKPAERRLLLEEAAGTAGLHARRHETELKLDAAEDNLARLDDVVATIEAQFETLKKQARQAQRYRRLGEHIRRSEALLLHARWRAAVAAAEQSAAELRAAEREVAEATEHALAEARAREAAEAALPPLRHAEAAAAAELQRLTHARDGAGAGAAAGVGGARRSRTAAGPAAADLDREDAHFAEARRRFARLPDERQALARAEAEDGPAHQAAAARFDRGSGGFGRSRSGVAARDRGRRCRRGAPRRARSAPQGAGRARRTAGGAPRRSRAATRELGRRARRTGDDRRGRRGRWRRRSGESSSAARWSRRGQPKSLTRSANEQAGTRRGAGGRAQLTRAASRSRGAESDCWRPAPNASGGPPVLSSLRVAAGFEAAIGAAFADDLQAPLDAGEGATRRSRFWVEPSRGRRRRSAARGRPSAGRSGDARPPALARSLAQAGWVESEEAGGALQPSLAPGQRLVDREGRLWRWDGFTALAAGPSPAAEYLRQRNRLAELERE